MSRSVFDTIRPADRHTNIHTHTDRHRHTQHTRMRTQKARVETYSHAQCAEEGCLARVAHGTRVTPGTWTRTTPKHHARPKSPHIAMPYTVPPAWQVTLLLGPCQKVVVVNPLRLALTVRSQLLTGDSNRMGREREDKNLREEGEGDHLCPRLSEQRRHWPLRRP